MSRQINGDFKYLVNVLNNIFGNRMTEEQKQQILAMLKNDIQQLHKM